MHPAQAIGASVRVFGGGNGFGGVEGRRSTRVVDSFIYIAIKGSELGVLSLHLAAFLQQMPLIMFATELTGIISAFFLKSHKLTGMNKTFEHTTFGCSHPIDTNSFADRRL